MCLKKVNVEIKKLELFKLTQVKHKVAQLHFKTDQYQLKKKALFFKNMNFFLERMLFPKPKQHFNKEMLINIFQRT